MSHETHHHLFIRICRRILRPAKSKRQAPRPDQLLKERGLELSWCLRVIEEPFIREVQEDKSIRFWGAVPECHGKYMRVVIYPNGTLRTAYFDEHFTRRVRRKPHLALECIRERLLNERSYRQALRRMRQLY